MTADRTLLLSNTGAISGMTYNITRTGGGNFNLNIGSEPLKSLVTNTWCEVVYNGTNWYLSKYGTL